MPRRRPAAFAAVRWVTIVAGGVIVVAAIAWAVLAFLRPAVVVTRVVEGPVVRAVYATGTVSPVREYPVRSNTAGIVTQVNVDKGSRVRAGDPLAVVSDPALTFAHDKATAELAEKRARADAATSPVLVELDARIAMTSDVLAIARREEKRMTDAVERGGATQGDVDRSLDRTRGLAGELAALQGQRAGKALELAREVAVAEAAVATARHELDQQTLRAPVDGAVLDRPTTAGTRVAVNEVILRVADVAPERLVMRAAVDEEDVTGVRVGQPVLMTLYSFPGRAFDGTVRTIYDEADANRRTFEVDVAIDVPDARLQPGMTGELAFVLERKERAEVIPTTAVQAGDAVYVVRDGRLAETRPKVGVRGVDRAEVVGLDRGEAVVISPVKPTDVGKIVRATTVEPREAVGLKEEQASEFKGFR